jgi:glycosyltransferase involved in cell wall biosynthesis
VTRWSRPAFRRIPPARVVFVPNGVDTRRYRPGGRGEACQSLAFPRHIRHVAFAGRLVAEKGLTTLLRAWRDVVDRTGEVHLHIVGDGPLRRELEAESCALGIGDSVTFHGEQRDVSVFLRAADCFVLPSTIEGMSNALLEAMACGLPLVATHIPGTSALVENGCHGILVPAGDAAALACAIVGVLTDPVRAEALGRQARRRVEDHFGIDRVADRYKWLYARRIA